MKKYIMELIETETEYAYLFIMIYLAMILIGWAVSELGFLKLTIIYAIIIGVYYLSRIIKIYEEK